MGSMKTIGLRVPLARRDPRVSYRLPMPPLHASLEEVHDHLATRMRAVSVALFADLAPHSCNGLIYWSLIQKGELATVVRRGVFHGTVVSFKGNKNEKMASWCVRRLRVSAPGFFRLRPRQPRRQGGPRTKRSCELRRRSGLPPGTGLWMALSTRSQ